MDLINRFYPESRFGGFTDLDGTVIFYTRVQALLTPGSVVVDVGCGRGGGIEDPVPTRKNLRLFKGKAAKVIGLDVDPAGQGNPLVDEFRLLTGPRWPLPDDSADLVLADWLLEHLEDPAGFFAEARRVLKRGGYLCLRTPNAWGYLGLMTRLVPNAWHRRLAPAFQNKRQDQDVFPTYFRCNTVGAVRRRLTQAGFEHAVYGYEAEPGYLSFSALAYWLGTLYQRFCPRPFRNTLFAFAQLREK